MICPVCHKNEATEEVVRYFGAFKSEGKVCPSCMHAALSYDAEEFYAVFYSDLLKTCRRCGRTLGEILNTMIVGCPHCYVEFAAELNPLIDNVQRRG